MTELVLFDCDGVLVDSETIICRIEADELTRIGFAITPQELATRFLGVSAATTYAEVERELGRPLPESFGACVEACVFKAFKRELRHISGVPEALVAIAQPVCVTSSASLDRIRLCLFAYRPTPLLCGEPVQYRYGRAQQTGTGRLSLRGRAHGFRAVRVSGD